MITYIMYEVFKRKKDDGLWVEDSFVCVKVQDWISYQEKNSKFVFIIWPYHIIKR